MNATASALRRCGEQPFSFCRELHIALTDVHPAFPNHAAPKSATARRPERWNACCTSQENSGDRQIASDSGVQPEPEKHMKTTLEKSRPKRDSKKRDDDFDEKMWRDRFPTEIYTVDSDDFDDYSPAYRLGTKLRSEINDFDLQEGDIRKRWDSEKGTSRLDWDRARDAVRSAWEFDEMPGAKTKAAPRD
jgi:hypothetical protein